MGENLKCTVIYKMSGLLMLFGSRGVEVIGANRVQAQGDIREGEVNKQK